MAGDSSFSDDWDAVRSDEAIQYAPVKLPEAPQPPDWLQRFFEWLSEVLQPAGEVLVWAWPVLKWGLVALAAALLLYLVWRVVDPATLRRRQPADEEMDWTPDQQAALALLDEADRLAAEGRFDEATHLLLLRSVGQIAELRPELIDPSSTAREIAAMPALPDKARHAFATIAGRVERSLFALRALSSEDWQAARDAYAEFALGYRGIAA